MIREPKRRADFASEIHLVLCARSQKSAMTAQPERMSSSIGGDGGRARSRCWGSTLSSPRTAGGGNASLMSWFESLRPQCAAWPEVLDKLLSKTRLHAYIAVDKTFAIVGNSDSHHRATWIDPKPLVEPDVCNQLNHVWLDRNNCA